MTVGLGGATPEIAEAMGATQRILVALHVRRTIRGGFY